MKSHCGDEPILRTSYLHNGISYIDKVASLYSIQTQVVTKKLWRVHMIVDGDTSDLRLQSPAKPELYS